MASKSPYSGKIKIFSDGADKKAMLEMNQNPLVKGLTTNPSLMKKSGVSDYVAFCKEILREIKIKPISFEVFADNFTEMKRQALEIASWGENVYVKIPITNSEAESSLALIKELSHSGVKLNVTAVLTLEQSWGACQALKGGAPSILSVFAGRIADTGRDPLPLMEASLEMCLSTDKNIELLWASSREVLNIVQADQMGCHIITATNDLIKKTAMFNKDLSQLSLETVRMFKADAESAGYSL
ncbi:MAG: transaldolase [Deltaproteobacteria bacterium]|nr:transaldolase [Deltaproteobacteria bacterium]MBM4317792.1 transaldolase [Deltaproteobacteria bacterium]